MNLIRSLGRKHLEIAGLWTQTAVAFGGSTVGLFLYFTDWKEVLRFVPWYGKKFEIEPPR